MVISKIQISFNSMEFKITEEECKDLGFFLVEFAIDGMSQRRYRKYPQPGVSINVIYTISSEGEYLAGWVEMIVGVKMINVRIHTLEELKTLYGIFHETILTE
jgi:hypothetical protein